MKRLKLMDPVIHDHTDRDVIAITKYHLQSIFIEAKKLQRAESMSVAFLSLSLAFLFPVITAETFRDIGPISAESLRSVSILLFLVCVGYTLVNSISWWKLRKTESIDTRVASLTQGLAFPTEFLVEKQKKQLERKRV